MSNFVTEQVPKSVQYSSEDILVHVGTVAQIGQCEGKWLVKLRWTWFNFQEVIWKLPWILFTTMAVVCKCKDFTDIELLTDASTHFCLYNSSNVACKQ